MIEIGKCLNCNNKIHITDCHFQCPHCGYAENWSEQPTYQVDKEKNSGENMPKMQMQYKKMESRKRSRIITFKDKKDRVGQD